MEASAVCRSFLDGVVIFPLHGTTVNSYSIQLNLVRSEREELNKSVEFVWYNILKNTNRENKWKTINVLFAIYLQL